MPEAGSLGARVMKGGSWVMIQMLVGNLLRLMSNLIMTRLLLPEAYGVMALVITIHAALQMLTDIAEGRNIAREPDGDQTHFLRTVWTVKIIRNVLIALLVVLISFGFLAFGPTYFAPGTVYADPLFPPLLAVSSVILVFKGLGSTKVGLAFRRLDYRSNVFLALTAQACGIGLMILFASISATPWALLFGMISTTLIATILSHVFLPGPSMRLHWDREIVGRIWRFGRWLMGSSLLTFVSQMGDRLILGALVPNETLGIYVIALLWVDVGRTAISRVGGVSFNTFSEIRRDRPAELPRLFRKFLRMIDLACLAGFCIMVLGGQFLIQVLYDENYQASGAYIPFLALGYLGLRYDVFGMLILAEGDSRSSTIISAMRATALCLGLWAGYQFLGIEGVLLAAALNPLVSAPYVLWRTSRILGRDRILRDLLWLALPLGLAVVMHLMLGPALT